MTASQAQHETRLKRTLPILNWLPSYNRKLLRFDVLAAVTVAAFVVPEAMAYAGLAGLPPEAGLYAAMTASIVYALFGQSRQLGVGPTSALSILAASSVGALAVGDVDRYASLAAMLAVFVGAVAILAWAFKLGFIVNFISESVLTGFSAGAALYISATQLGKLFGIEGGGGDFFERVYYVVRHFGETSGWTLAIGLGGIAVLLAGARFAPKLPWSLIVVLASIALLAFTSLADQGVAIIGDIPSGLPAPSVPDIQSGDVDNLVAAALAVFLMAYVEGTGATQTFAKKHKYSVDGNQELLAVGASNAACGLFQAYPVGGGFSRTAVNDEAGARTQLAGLGTGLLVGVVALFLTGLFYNLPEAILGAVVIVAVKGLFNVPALRRLYQVSRREFWIAMAAMGGVLVFGMLEGVLIGVVLSLLILLFHASQPTSVLLGRVPGTTRFSDLSRHPDNEVIPEVLVYRVDGGLFYANAEVVSSDLERLIDARDTPPQLVVFDLSSSPRIDLAAADMLVELDEALVDRGVTLRLAHVEGPVRDKLRDIGAGDRFGVTHYEVSIADIISAWRVEQGTSAS